MSLVAFLIVGFVVGLIARAAVPGNQRMRFLATTALGVIGSVVGGLVSSLFYSRATWLDVHPTSIVFSFLGAVLVLGLMSVTVRWTDTRA